MIASFVILLLKGKRITRKKLTSPFNYDYKKLSVKWVTCWPNLLHGSLGGVHITLPGIKVTYDKLKVYYDIVFSF